MDLDGIDVFVEVVDAQSFTRAASRLAMPITTVSAKVARLEQRLGVTLIQRTTRQLRVTTAGRSFYDHCVRALSEIAEAEQEIAAALEAPTGTLRITAPADLANTLLAPLVERFLAAYPKAGIELIVTNQIVDLVGDGVDLAVRVGPLEDSSLIIRKFTAGRLALFASKAYLKSAGAPQDPADLQRHAFVTLSRLKGGPVLTSPTGDVIDLDRPTRLVTDDFGTLKTFLQRGAGIGLLPDFMGHDAGAGLAPVLPAYTSQAAPVFFAYPAQRFVSPSVRAFIGLAETGERALPERRSAP